MLLQLDYDLPIAPRGSKNYAPVLHEAPWLEPEEHDHEQSEVGRQEQLEGHQYASSEKPHETHHECETWEGDEDDKLLIQFFKPPETDHRNVVQASP